MWRVEFPEIFQEGGFDIAIGNPPYVRQERILEIKPALEQQFPEVFAGKADLYVYFYKRGAELLRTNGILAYISSNKFLRSGYGENLRTFFTHKVNLHRLLDFGSVPVFKANVDTCIVLFESNVPCAETFLAATFCNEADVPRLPEAFQERSFTMDVCDLPSDGWALALLEPLTLLRKLQQIGTPLGEYVDGDFYMGVKTGYNCAFIINESVRRQLIAADAKSNELIKPVLRGGDLKKWKTESTGDYLIFTRRGIDIEQYPAVKQYLSQYRERLEPKKSREQKLGRKKGNYKWYEIQDTTAYYVEFEKSKIIYPETGKFMYGCYDTTKAFGLNSTFFIPTNDLSLLAILNSRLFDWYARHKFQNLKDPWAGGGLRFFTQYMEKVPIADRSVEQKAALTGFVEQILADPESDGVREIECKIDELVYEIYDLTDAEVELIKRTYRDAGMEV